MWKSLANRHVYLRYVIMPIVTVIHFNQFYAGLCHLANLGMVSVTFNAFIFILERITILQSFMIISVLGFVMLLRYCISVCI